MTRCKLNLVSAAIAFFGGTFLSVVFRSPIGAFGVILAVIWLIAAWIKRRDLTPVESPANFVLRRFLKLIFWS